MCVKFTTKIRQTKKKRVAYKIVRHAELVHSVFFSEWLSYNRETQSGYKDNGGDIRYKIGELVESDMDITPGIFMYPKRGFYFRDSCTRSLLKMEIPKGTRYRLGKEIRDKRPVICVEKAIPIEEVSDRCV